MSSVGAGKTFGDRTKLKPCFSGVQSRFLIVETASSIILSLQRQKCRYGPWIGSDPAVGLVGARNHRILYSSDFSSGQVISPISTREHHLTNQPAYLTLGTLPKWAHSRPHPASLCNVMLVLNLLKQSS